MNTLFDDIKQINVNKINILIELIENVIVQSNTICLLILTQEHIEQVGSSKAEDNIYEICLENNEENKHKY